MVCIDVRDVARAHINAITIPEAAGNRHIAATSSAWFAEMAKVRDPYLETFAGVVKPKDAIIQIVTSTNITRCSYYLSLVNVVNLVWTLNCLWI